MLSNCFEYETEFSPCVLLLPEVWLGGCLADRGLGDLSLLERSVSFREKSPRGHYASPSSPVDREPNYKWQGGNSGQQSILEWASVAPCVAGGHWSGLLWNKLKAESLYCMGLLRPLLSYVRVGFHLDTLWSVPTTLRIQVRIFTQFKVKRQQISRIALLLVSEDLMVLHTNLVVMEVFHPPTHNVSANSHCPPTHVHILTHVHTDKHTIAKQMRTECPDIVIIISCCALMCWLRWQFSSTPLRAACCTVWSTEHLTLEKLILSFSFQYSTHFHVTGEGFRVSNQ